MTRDDNGGALGYGHGLVAPRMRRPGNLTRSDAAIPRAPRYVPTALRVVLHSCATDIVVQYSMLSIPRAVWTGRECHDVPSVAR